MGDDPYVMIKVGEGVARGMMKHPVPGAPSSPSPRPASGRRTRNSTAPFGRSFPQGSCPMRYWTSSRPRDSRSPTSQVYRRARNLVIHAFRIS